MKDAFDLRIGNQCNGVVFHEAYISDFNEYDYFVYHDAYQLYDPITKYQGGIFIMDVGYGPKQYQNIAYQIKLFDDNRELVKDMLYVALVQVLEGSDQFRYARYCQCEWCQMSWFNPLWLVTWPEDYGCLKYTTFVDPLILNKAKQYVKENHNII